MVTYEGYILGGTWRTIDNDHIEITINTPVFLPLSEPVSKAIFQTSFSEDKTELTLTGLGQSLAVYKITSTNPQHMPTLTYQGETPASTSIPTPVYQGIYQGETPPPTSVPGPIYQGTLVYQATLEVKGGVFACANGTTGNMTVSNVSFVLTNATKGQAIDLSPNTGGNNTHVTIISYTDNNQHVSDLPWTVQFIGKNNGDTLLEQDEQAVITVNLETVANGGLLTKSPGAYDTFTIEVKPVTGASLIINRTLPAKIDPVMNLD